MPDFYSRDIGFSIHGFAFSLPNSGGMKNLLTPKDNLINGLSVKQTSSFFQDGFELSQETRKKRYILIKKGTNEVTQIISFNNPLKFFV